MTSSPDSILLCPACAGQNAPDSKFCRHCGHALDAAAALMSANSAAPVAITSEPLSPVAELEIPDVVLPLVVTSGAVATPETVAAGEADVEAMSSPGEIDGRRARQLLERAQGLSDRGDSAGAILACRQAIALAPAVVGGQAMLGALLERSGDLPHAVQALEKAVQLAPESGAGRDLARLRDKMGVPPENAPVFHFDDAELFGDESPTNAPVTAPVVTAPVAMPEGATDSASPVLEDRAVQAAREVAADAESARALAGDEDGLASTAQAEAFPAAIVAAPVAAPRGIVVDEVSDAPRVAAVAAAIPPFRERRIANIPVRVERRMSAGTGVSTLGTPIGARVIAPTVATAINPLLLVDSSAKPQGLNALWGRSSYFGRSLPLVGATILSLGFLGWTRGLAARNLASAPVVQVVQSGDIPTVAPVAPAPSSNLPALAPVGSTPVNSGGFPISNQPITTQVVTPPLIVQSSVPTIRVAPAPVAAAVSRRPARILPVIPPAPISSLGTVRSATPPRSNNGGLTLPPPVIAQPGPAAPPISVLPDGGAGALNPAGSPGNGYVRITRGRVGSLLPQRPAGRAGDAERAAAAAARGGSPAQAIDGLTAAINANASDAGYRFQQRAILFLAQGDYSRAVDDFQSAISAYNDQIARGDQIASARAGLSAARSGLNRALAGGR